MLLIAYLLAILTAIEIDRDFLYEPSHEKNTLNIKKNVQTIYLDGIQDSQRDFLVLEITKANSDECGFLEIKKISPFGYSETTSCYIKDSGFCLLDTFYLKPKVDSKNVYDLTFHSQKSTCNVEFLYFQSDRILHVEAPKRLERISLITPSYKNLILFVDTSKVTSMLKLDFVTDHSSDKKLKVKVIKTDKDIIGDEEDLEKLKGEKVSHISYYQQYMGKFNQNKTENLIVELQNRDKAKYHVILNNFSFPKQLHLNENQYFTLNGIQGKPATQKFTLPLSSITTDKVQLQFKSYLHNFKVKINNGKQFNEEYVIKYHQLIDLNIDQNKLHHTDTLSITVEAERDVEYSIMCLDFQETQVVDFNEQAVIYFSQKDSYRIQNFILQYAELEDKQVVTVKVNNPGSVQYDLFVKQGHDNIDYKDIHIGQGFIAQAENEHQPQVKFTVNKMDCKDCHYLIAVKQSKNTTPQDSKITLSITHNSVVHKVFPGVIYTGELNQGQKQQQYVYQLNNDKSVSEIKIHFQTLSGNRPKVQLGENTLSSEVVLKDLEFKDDEDELSYAIKNTVEGSDHPRSLKGKYFITIIGDENETRYSLQLGLTTTFQDNFLSSYSPLKITLGQQNSSSIFKFYNRAGSNQENVIKVSQIKESDYTLFISEDGSEPSEENYVYKMSSNQNHMNTLIIKSSKAQTLVGKLIANNQGNELHVYEISLYKSGNIDRIYMNQMRRKTIISEKAYPLIVDVDKCEDIQVFLWTDHTYNQRIYSFFSFNNQDFMENIDIKRNKYSKKSYFKVKYDQIPGCKGKQGSTTKQTFYFSVFSRTKYGEVLNILVENPRNFVFLEQGLVYPQFHPEQGQYEHYITYPSQVNPTKVFLKSPIEANVFVNFIHEKIRYKEEDFPTEKSSQIVFEHSKQDSMASKHIIIEPSKVRKYCQKNCVMLLSVQFKTKVKELNPYFIQIFSQKNQILQPSHTQSATLKAQQKAYYNFTIPVNRTIIYIQLIQQEKSEDFRLGNIEALVHQIDSPNVWGLDYSFQNYIVINSDSFEVNESMEGAYFIELTNNDQAKDINYSLSFSYGINLYSIPFYSQSTYLVQKEDPAYFIVENNYNYTISFTVESLNGNYKWFITKIQDEHQIDKSILPKVDNNFSSGTQQKTVITIKQDDKNFCVHCKYIIGVFSKSQTSQISVSTIYGSKIYLSAGVQRIGAVDKDKVNTYIVNVKGTATLLLKNNKGELVYKVYKNCYEKQLIDQNLIINAQVVKANTQSEKSFGKSKDFGACYLIYVFGNVDNTQYQIQVLQENQIQRIFSGLPQSLTFVKPFGKDTYSPINFEVNDIIDHQNTILTITIENELPHDFTNILDYIQLYQKHPQVHTPEINLYDIGEKQAYMNFYNRFNYVFPNKEFQDFLQVFEIKLLQELSNGQDLRVTILLQSDYNYLLPRQAQHIFQYDQKSSVFQLVRPDEKSKSVIDIYSCSGYVKSQVGQSEYDVTENLGTPLKRLSTFHHSLTYSHHNQTTNDLFVYVLGIPKRYKYKQKDLKLAEYEISYQFIEKDQVSPYQAFSAGKIQNFTYNNTKLNVMFKRISKNDGHKTYAVKKESYYFYLCQNQIYIQEVAVCRNNNHDLKELYENTGFIAKSLFLENEHVYDHKNDYKFTVDRTQHIAYAKKFDEIKENYIYMVIVGELQMENGQLYKYVYPEYEIKNFWNDSEDNNKPNVIKAVLIFLGVILVLVGIVFAGLYIRRLFVMLKMKKENNFIRNLNETE